MLRKWSFALGLMSLGLIVAAPVKLMAGVIIAPVSATIEDGGPGFGSITDTLNQSGLSSGYTSGVTDFDTYIASSPTHITTFSGFEWFSNSETTGATVTYDLGSVQTIDALALWNEESSGIGSLDLLGSLDGFTFFSIATALAPFDNPLADYPADVFSWAALATRYVRFVITDSPQPDPGSFPAVGIGEVAFRVSAPTAVPEPGTLTLVGLGAFSLVAGAIRRRRQQKAAV